jgi:hypothetical protein
LVLMSIITGLAFLTRNDSVILSLVLIGYIAVRSHQSNSPGPEGLLIAQAAGILALFIIAQTAFRLAYYGEALPNTYYLKLTHYPLKIRLIDGFRFVLEFLSQAWMLFALAAVALWRRRRAGHLLLAALVAATLAYQVYVGGDPWKLWRLLTPAVPPLIVLAVSGADVIASWLVSPSGSLGVDFSVLALVAAAIVVADLPFGGEMAVAGPTSAGIANRVNTDSAIAISALTLPDASVGVIWAGTLPYYVDRYTIDYLGKSDPYIARLDADVSGSSGWDQQISIPGHNKYDLDYSIVQLQPTYSQVFSWGYATVRPYFVEHYARVEYHGAAGTKTVFLLKDSPLVCWEACKDEYRIIPWPEEK